MLSFVPIKYRVKVSVKHVGPKTDLYWTAHRVSPGGAETYVDGGDFEPTERRAIESGLATAREDAEERREELAFEEIGILINRTNDVTKGGKIVKAINYGHAGTRYGIPFPVLLPDGESHRDAICLG